MKSEMDISLMKRMNILRKEIEGEALQQELLRRVKQYSNDYKKYLKTAEVTDHLKVGSDKDGGYLVPDEMEEGIQEALKENDVIRKIARIITTTQLLKIPGLAKGPTGIWVEEGGELTFTDMEYYQVVIDAHKNGIMLRVTDELLEDSGFDIEKYLTKSVGETIGELEEDAFINGNGEHRPRGFVLDAEVGAESSDLTADSLIELQVSLGSEFSKNAVWVMSDEAEQALRKIKNYGGRPIWEPDVTKKTPDRLLGRPVYVSKAMPKVLPGNCPVAYGDFSYYWIGERGKRSIKRLNERYADQGMVGFRYTHRVDGKLIVPEAIKTLKIAA